VDDFVAFAVMILIMTNLVTTVGVYLFENQRFQARWRDWGERFRERRGEKNEERARSKAQKKAERAAAMDKKREARRR
jgi:hypothetical protein